MTALTAAQVTRMLRYEPDTGRLYWKDRPREMFSSDQCQNAWNARFAGAEAMCRRDSGGYLGGKIFNQSYRAHRVVWLLQTGAWPTQSIDHINGIRDDNRWSNLRTVTRSENQRNQALRADNTSGVNGVFWCAGQKRWRAVIKVDGARRYLGYFDTIEAAASARAVADRSHGFSDRHGKPAQAIADAAAALKPSAS